MKLQNSNPAPAFDCDEELTFAMFEDLRVKFLLKHSYIHSVRQSNDVSGDVLELKFIDHRDLPLAAVITYQLRLDIKKKGFQR